MLNHLQMPQAIKDLGKQPMEMTLESYQRYWSWANENISCAPGPLSFSTMKAGASSMLVSRIGCLLTRIPLKAGYVPSRWKQFVDVMIKKRRDTLT
jgi:hypothetical protein